MDEAVHALATAALADGVKRLALSCRTIERVELTVTMPQGGSVAVAAHGIALCKRAPRPADGCRSGRRRHHDGSTSTGRGGQPRHRRSPQRNTNDGVDGAAAPCRLERSRLRLVHRWRARRLVVFWLLRFGITLRPALLRWLQAARATLAGTARGVRRALPAASNSDSTRDVELPAASVLGARCCSEVASAQQPAHPQRQRLNTDIGMPLFASLAAATSAPRAPKQPTLRAVLEQSAPPPDNCGPRLVAKVTDRSGANASAADVRSALEAHATRMGLSDLASLRFDVCVNGGVAYITCTLQQANMLMSREQRGCVDLLHRHKSRPPLRLRIVDHENAGALLIEAACSR